MARVTTGLLKADDPIFREGISRTHPLLEKKRLLAMLSERDKVPEQEATADGPKTSAGIEHAGHERHRVSKGGDDEQHSG